MLLVAPAANAQAILNKLKDKASEAIGGSISDKIGGAISDKIGGSISDKIGGAIKDKTGLDVNEMSESGGLSVVRSTDMVQPRHSSSFCWTEPVAPSSAKFPVPLLNELPAVPAASELANPTEEVQAAYYRAIKAVTLRAEDLNKDTTCDDEMAKLWRDDYEKALAEAFGISRAELEQLESGNLTPEEEEALQGRIVARLLNGKSVEEIQAEAVKMQGKGEDEMVNDALRANFAVYDKYSKEIKTYMGVTSDELKDTARRASAASDAEAERINKELDQKIKAYQKQQSALDKNFKAEADDFGKKFQKELMAATMNAVPAAGMAMDVLKGVNRAEKALSPLMEREKKLEKYAKDVMAAWPATCGDMKPLSAAETKKLEDIKARIYATEDPSVYNPLYLQAGEIIKNYRLKVAQAWAADVQKRFDAVKAAMPELIKLQRQAVEDQLIPECALWRTPLNLVIEAGDLLEEAYSDFPDDYPTLFDTEVVRKVKLEPGETAWWPEFYVASETMDDILAGKNIFKYSGGTYYQFDKGKWNPVPENFGLGKKAKTVDIASQTWTSQDGKRTVRLDAEYGQQLFLPEGDIVSGFVAIEKVDNKIVWAYISTVEDAGQSYYIIKKCTYKL